MATITTEINQPRNTKPLLYASIVIIVAFLATTLSQFQVLGLIPLKNLLKNELHADRAATAGFFFWIGLAWYFKPIAGIITDAFPLFGTRRRSYMLFSAIFAIVFWVVLYFTPHQYGKLLWVIGAINVFTVVTSTVAGGYMVEMAQQFSAPGRLTSVRNFVEQFCILVSGPAGGFLGGVAFGWTAVAGGSLMFLLVPGTLLFLQEQQKKINSKEILHQARKQLVNVASAKSMWAAAGFMALFYCAPGIVTAVFYRQQDVLHLNTQGQGTMLFLNGAFGVLAAILYGAFAARRFNLRTLLVVGLSLGAASQLAYIFYSTVTRARIIESFYGFGYTMAELAMMHLAVRATPAGSEGLGFSLMISVRNLALYGSDWVGSKALDTYHLQFSTLVLANAFISFLAVPLVFLLPTLIASQRDAQGPAVPVPIAHALQE